MNVAYGVRKWTQNNLVTDNLYGLYVVLLELVTLLAVPSTIMFGECLQDLTSGINSVSPLSVA